MKIFYTLILSLLFISVRAQKADNRLVVGTVDTVYSKILNEKRAIYIHVPNGDKNQRYPVLYLIDGEAHFYSAAGIVQQMAGVIPDMIIVGITNTVRERDLTPTHVQPDFIVGAGDAKISGGGEAFISFIEKELIPYVNTKYPTAPYKVLSGHSLGGLTVVNTFINHTDLFNAYIAIDPSLWWDKQKLLKKAEQDVATRNFTGKSLFIGIANNIPPGLDTISVMKDTTDMMSVVTRSIFPLVKALKDAGINNKLRWNYKFYPHERHGTVELVAEYDALRYLFNYYQFRTSQFEGHPELNVDSVMSAHYKNISDHFGYTVLPSEDLVNQMAYSCMGQHRTDEAFRLFKRNVENYPKSANAYDSLGDFYMDKGDKQNAIAAFTKSLKLEETADTKRKLNELLK